LVKAATEEGEKEMKETKLDLEKKPFLFLEIN
jgi:hypothetical protein